MAADYEDIDLLNFGFASLQEDDGIYFSEEKENKLCLNLQLYEYTIKQQAKVQDMKGKRVLDLGCGRGGGLTFVIT